MLIIHQTSYPIVTNMNKKQVSSLELPSFFHVKKVKVMTCGQVWGPIHQICAMHLTHPGAHTQE